MSCERYFVEFPPEDYLTVDTFLDDSLALVYPSDIRLHRTVFLVPFEPMMVIKMEKKRPWSETQSEFDYNPATVLRKNIKFMISKTRHFGLLISQLTWFGLLNYAEQRHVLRNFDETLRSAALYIMMLKKESTGLTQFINCLHMTGNHQIANVIEDKLELLENDVGYFEQYEQCTCPVDDERFESYEERHGHAPPKKRKTADSSSAAAAKNEEDDDDDTPDIETSFAAAAAAAALTTLSGYVRKKYKCHIRPLDAVDVIAIVNGREDCESKVELCKCGHYHQYPKWKDVNCNHAAMSRKSSFSYKNNVLNVGPPSGSSLSSKSTSGGFSKYFKRRASLDETSSSGQATQGILSPVLRSQQVEVGLDLSHGISGNDEFTKPRRSCAHLRLRFSTENSFAEPPETIPEEDDNSTEGENKKAGSLISKLPRFLRKILLSNAA